MLQIGYVLSKILNKLCHVFMCNMNAIYMGSNKLNEDKINYKVLTIEYTVVLRRN